MSHKVWLLTLTPELAIAERNDADGHKLATISKEEDEGTRGC